MLLKEQIEYLKKEVNHKNIIIDNLFVSEKIVTGKSDFKSFANKPANDSSDLEKWHSSGNIIIIPSNKELSVSPNFSSPHRCTLIMDQESNFSEEYQINNIHRSVVKINPSINCNFKKPEIILNEYPEIWKE